MITRFARRWTSGILASLALIALPTMGSAATVVLEDTGLNASLTIDTAVGNAIDWTVEGINNLALRDYFIRFGTPGIGNPELPINDTNFVLSGGNPYDNDFFPGNEGLSVLYYDVNQQVRIIENTTLVPGLVGSNESTFTDSIRIDNLTAAPLQVSLFLYGNYTLLNSLVNDVAAIVGPRSLDQLYDGAIFETSVTVTPTHFQVGDATTLLTTLLDGDSTTLNDNPIAVNDNLAYAFQWDFLIGPSQSILLGSSNSITVPEVSTLTLFSIAGLSMMCGTIVARRRQS